MFNQGYNFMGCLIIWVFVLMHLKCSTSHHPVWTCFSAAEVTLLNTLWMHLKIFHTHGWADEQTLALIIAAESSWRLHQLTAAIFTGAHQTTLWIVCFKHLGHSKLPKQESSQPSTLALNHLTLLQTCVAKCVPYQKHLKEGCCFILWEKMYAFLTDRENLWTATD